MSRERRNSKVEVKGRKIIFRSREVTLSPHKAFRNPSVLAQILEGRWIHKEEGGLLEIERKSAM